jgi:hypothetical protein
VIRGHRRTMHLIHSGCCDHDKDPKSSNNCLDRQNYSMRRYYRLSSETSKSAGYCHRSSISQRRGTTYQRRLSTTKSLQILFSGFVFISDTFRFVRIFCRCELHDIYRNTLRGTKLGCQPFLKPVDRSHMVPTTDKEEYQRRNATSIK